MLKITGMTIPSCQRVILGLVFVLGVNSWVNHYDAPFTFKCPEHQSINQVVSHHNNGAEDRLFDFQCKQYTTATESCQWSGYVNDFDGPVAFQCPNGGVLDGVSSYHDNGFKDRRFRFYCCEKPGDCCALRDHPPRVVHLPLGMCLYNCYYSGWVNKFDGDINYTVPASHVMRGWVSEHYNGAENLYKKITSSPSVQWFTCTWPEFKHYNTFKLFVGVAPNGLVTFISRVWYGTVLDRYIVENVVFLPKLVPGDMIMADKEFTIEDLTAKEFYQTQGIASARIVVEMKMEQFENYRILSGTLPLSETYLAEQTVFLWLSWTDPLPPLMK